MGDKRKRQAKTSYEQIEEYLNMMESDQMFRTGTINPTVKPTYVEDCWSLLTTRLNSCGSGPVLSSGEWKKRFTDWKNSTRAKYRKKCEERKKTGGGNASVIVLTPHEERGLTVWGKVAVTGTPKVATSGGFQQEAFTLPLNLPKNINTEPEELEMEEHLIQTLPEPETKQETFTNLVQKPKSTTAKRFVQIKRRNSSRPVASIGEEFLNCYKAAENENTKRKLDIEEKKIFLEEKKLKFEIAKYKFENPTFIFDD